MKSIFVLFAILAITNCSTFLRNLACTTQDAANTQEICTECHGTFTKGKCTCGENEKFDSGCVEDDGIRRLRRLGDCSSATLDAITDGDECENNCGGTWTKPTCTCTSQQTFTNNQGCVDKSSDTDTEEKTCDGIADLAHANSAEVCAACKGTWASNACTCAERYSFTPNTGCTAPTCTIKTTDALEKATAEATCKDCYLKYDSSADDAKKCTCPDTDAEKAKIIDKTACETVCGYTFNSTSNTCSGIYLKVASALLGLLFLL